ncbi:methyltransferase-like protein 22 isoform X1 [Conger conger]|uniref:methyltransferase-like protein 22 isoform X1 n=1 Tax=Conger conger TaxID=82655 RepID=UPI002A5A8440|nr:methyltransferase-like protein 22 isoform X1 [Conger conger]XP_061080449.1 methyltransferase-like protein 22 isoform X1 [Conger conger]
MDQVTFRSDTVLSDVHLLFPNARHLMTRLNAVGQPVFISRFNILRDSEGAGEAGDGASTADAGDDPGDDAGAVRGGEEEAQRGRRKERGTQISASLDEDGDLDVMRRPTNPTAQEPGVATRHAICPIVLTQGGGAPADAEEEEEPGEGEELRADVLIIEHTMATPMEDVGKQVWRGAILLADFILSQPILFQGATVLELGAGTGITSIVAATLAKRVYCTDVGQDLLSMCQRNVTLNRHLLDPADKVRIRELDWLGDEFSTETGTEFSWTEEEVADLHDNATLLLAADVCYDDELTNAFFRTIYRLTSHFRHPSTIYLSIEKRLNFTLRHMDVSCEAYDHFCRCLDDLGDMADGRTRFTVERVAPQFPQFFYYERIEQLELWKVTASPL